MVAGSRALDHIVELLCDGVSLHVEHIVGRADPTGVESDNLELSRRRANVVRDRLIAAGARGATIAVDATGSTDPLPADSPTERARLNRSVSFIVQAQPSTRATGAERVR